MTTYTFNTHMAKHTFCKTCGVQSFYTPRSNPDGFGEFNTRWTIIGMVFFSLQTIFTTFYRQTALYLALFWTMEHFLFYVKKKFSLIWVYFHMYFAMTLQVWHLIVWTLEQWEVWLWRISVGKTGRKVCRSIILLEVCQNQQRTHNWRFPMAFWIVWLSDCSFSQMI